MSFDYSTLITDRNQADLGSLRSLLTKKLSDWTAAEKAEFALARNKGSYNHTDLNRVSAAMEDLKAIMNGYGYDVPGYERLVVKHTNLPGDVTEYDKYTWYHFDIPTVADTERYLANVQAIRNVITTPQRTPSVPGDMEEFTLKEANDIEEILAMMEFLLKSMTQTWRICGTFRAGNNIRVQLIRRR